MNEFCLFQVETRDYLKKLGYKGLTPNKEVLNIILRLNNTPSHTETYKKLTKKINLIVINSLFISNDNTAMAYFIKIKKLNIPLRVKKDFMNKLDNLLVTDKNDLIEFIKKVDLFLQAFNCDKNKKEELFNQYVTLQINKLKTSYQPKEIRQLKLEEIEKYQVYREKRKLELSLIENLPIKPKVKI